MKAARELTRRVQVRAELYRAVQQLSEPTPLGPDFLVNTLLTEALNSPEIIERARLSLAVALRRYADDLERRKDHAGRTSARRKVIMDTLMGRIKRGQSKAQRPADNVDEPNGPEQLHDTPALSIDPDIQQIQFLSWIQEQLKTTEINRPASSIHTHQDGLLLASPRIFKDFAEATNCRWRICQMNVFKSDCFEHSEGHYVKRYRTANRFEANRWRHYFHCVVVRAEFCNQLFGELPAPNPHIVERVSW